MSSRVKSTGRKNELINETIDLLSFHLSQNFDKKKTLEKSLLIEFPDFSMDGMRMDRRGNLLISRHGKGTVAMVSAAGKLLREIDVLGTKPSNVALGGRDGRTVYVTEMEKGRLVRFRIP